MNELKNLSIDSNIAATAAIADLKLSGNRDLWVLLSKASSDSQGWMKSTKAMEIEGLGCLVQATTQQGDNVAEALEFVPGARIGGSKEEPKLIKG